MSLPFRRPALQLQFSPRTATSGYDCTAAAAAGAADADSRGQWLFNHSQVRLASDEPTPDPASPGLNINQATTALSHLTGGQVHLEVHPTQSDFGPAASGVLAGRWALLALWRGVLIRYGFGGDVAFSEGHACLWGYDQNLGDWILNDPLIGHWWVGVSPQIAAQACLTLLRRKVSPTAVGAYYALTRDVFDPGQPATEVPPVKYISYAGDPAALPGIPVSKGTPILDLQGAQWGTIEADTQLRKVGNGDGHSDTPSVLINTARYYTDGVRRQTVQLVKI